MTDETDDRLRGRHPTRKSLIETMERCRIVSAALARTIWKCLDVIDNGDPEAYGEELGDIDSFVEVAKQIFEAADDVFDILDVDAFFATRGKGAIAEVERQVSVATAWHQQSQHFAAKIALTRALNRARLAVAIAEVGQVAGSDEGDFFDRRAEVAQFAKADQAAAPEGNGLSWAELTDRATEWDADNSADGLTEDS